MRSILSALAISAIFAAPCFADQYYDYACTLMQRGQYQNAAMYFGESLKRKPTPQCLYQAAVCAQRMNKTAAAENGFQTLLQLYPNSAQAPLAHQALKAMGIQEHHMPNGRAVSAPKKAAPPAVPAGAAVPTTSTPGGVDGNTVLVPPIGSSTDSSGTTTSTTTTTTTTP